MGIFKFLKGLRRKKVNKEMEEPTEIPPDMVDNDIPSADITRPSVKHISFNRSKMVTRKHKRPTQRREFYSDDGDLHTE